MSHIVRVKNIEMSDQVAREMAVARMDTARYVKPGTKRGQRETAQSEAEATGTHGMYGSQKAEGIGIMLEGWDYPIVINAESKPQYDSYGCRAGTSHEIDELVAYYSCEKAKIDAQLKGICLQEVETEDEIKLVATIDG